MVAAVGRSAVGMGLAVVDVAAMDPVSLIDAANVLMTVDSVKKIEEWLA